MDDQLRQIAREHGVASARYITEAARAGQENYITLTNVLKPTFGVISDDLRATEEFKRLVYHTGHNILDEAFESALDTAKFKQQLREDLSTILIGTNFLFYKTLNKKIHERLHEEGLHIMNRTYTPKTLEQREALLKRIREGDKKLLQNQYDPAEINIYQTPFNHYLAICMLAIDLRKQGREKYAQTMFGTFARGPGNYEFYYPIETGQLDFAREMLEHRDNDDKSNVPNWISPSLRLTIFAIELSQHAFWGRSLHEDPTPMTRTQQIKKWWRGK